MVSARAAALRALVALATGHADRLREALDAARLRGREQGFAFELAHGVVRRERLLDHVIGGLAHRGLPRDHTQLAALRLGAYQLLFVDGMPAHAAVGETVALVRNNRGFVNAILRRLADRIESRDDDRDVAADELALGPRRVLKLPTPLPTEPHERLAVLHSLPTFLLERWRDQHGVEALLQIAAAATAIPSLWLRPAPDVDAATLQAELAENGVLTEPSVPPGFLRCVGGESPFASEAFAAGRFVVQDPTAFRAGDALPCAPGDTVVDLCAAPGTKTTWLATKVRPGGTVIAFDVDPARRGRIAENVVRLRLEDAVTIAADLEDLPVAAAAVLVDVPCSNSGVLGRRVEVRRRLGEATFARLAVVQRELLAQALGLVQPGGHVVYSTCSIDREENEAVVASELAEKSGFELLEQHLTLPVAGCHDGGFFAVIRRI